jgi:DNA replication protein DnaC
MEASCHDHPAGTAAEKSAPDQNHGPLTGRGRQSRSGKVSYEEYLARLVEMEAMGKLEHSINAKIQKARFPAIKTIEEFDFSFQPGLNEKEANRLTSLEFTENRENLLFQGLPGVDKTHLAMAFGVKACLAKYRVLFIRTPDPLAQLGVAQQTSKLGQT